MAFMAGLMGALGGQATGRVDAYRDQLAHEAQQQQLAQQQQEFDARQKEFAAQQAQLAKENRFSGMDLQLTDKQRYVNPKATLDERARHFQNIAGIAMGQGALGAVAPIEQQARDTFTAAHQARADADKLQEISVRAQHYLAQQKHWSAQEKAAYARITENWNAAVLRGDVTADVAAKRIAGELQATGMRDAAMIYSTMTRDSDAMTRDVYNQQGADYRTLIRPENPVYSSLDPNAQPPAPPSPVTVNVGQTPGGAGMDLSGLMQAALGVKPTKAAPTQSQSNGGGDPYNQLSKEERQTVDGIVTKSRGRDPQTTRHALDQMVQEKLISQEVKNAVLVRLGNQGASGPQIPQIKHLKNDVAPLLTNAILGGGGSQGTNPF